MKNVWICGFDKHENGFGSKFGRAPTTIQTGQNSEDCIHLRVLVVQAKKVFGVLRARPKKNDATARSGTRVGVSSMLDTGYRVLQTFSGMIILIQNAKPSSYIKTKQLY